MSSVAGSRALDSKTTLPGCTYTEPAAAGAYPQYRLVSCSGRSAMISTGSNWLNRQIICRQESKQTGMMKLFKLISLPCLRFRWWSHNKFETQQDLLLCVSQNCFDLVIQLIALWSLYFTLMLSRGWTVITLVIPNFSMTTSSQKYGSIWPNICTTNILNTANKKMLVC